MCNWQPKETLKLLEPSFIYRNILDHRGLYPKIKLFELIGELVAVNEINRRCAITGSLLYSVTRKSACCDKQPFVCTTDHRASEITNVTGRYNALISLALENDVKAHKTVDACNPLTINTAIACTTCDFDLNKARFAEEPLDEAFKR